MTMYNKCLEILNDENPVIVFEHTYTMRDQFKAIGAIDPQSEKWLLKPAKYRVSHGNGYFTQNEFITGKNNVKMEDIL